MKSIFMLLMFVSFVSFSQSNTEEIIGELVYKDNLISKCEKSNDNNYTITFNDITEETWEVKINGKSSFELDQNKSEYDTLYKSIVEGFENDDIKKNVEISNGDLQLNYRKQFVVFSKTSLGFKMFNNKKRVQFHYQDKDGKITSSDWMTENQIEELFGKA